METNSYGKIYNVIKTNPDSVTSNIENYISTIGSPITATSWPSIPYSVHSNAWNCDYYINLAIEKLPTILQIRSYQKEGNVLNIKYNTILDKFLPESGTLYVYNTNIYGIFNQNDDKYWYKKLSLTFDIKDLEKIISKKLKIKYAILLNDYDIKLSNEEIENLSNPIKYKDFAHSTLEEILNSEKFNLKSKSTKLDIHNALESKLVNLYE